MRTFLLCLLLVASATPFAQTPPPAIKWQQAISENTSENGQYIARTPDGGSIIAGYDDGAGGLGNHGGIDFLVTKLNSNGGKEWSESLGGSADETASAIEPTTDGGYIVVGSTTSKDGQVGNVPRYTTNGVYGWVVKLNSTGSIEWKQKFVPPTAGSILLFRSCKQVPTGEYFLSGDNNGALLIKLSATGSVLWQKNLSPQDSTGSIYSINKTNDGGFILSGLIRPRTIGATYAWVAKIDTSGSIFWQKRYEKGLNSMANCIQQASDNNFVFAGYFAEKPLPGKNADRDAWIVKLNTTGDIIWEKTIKGSKDEEFKSLSETPDGDFVFVGSTLSNDGDITGNHSTSSDAIVYKFNALGNIKWSKILGGDGYDAFNSLAINPDGGFTCTGTAGSTNGDLAGIDSSIYYSLWVIDFKADTAKRAQSIAFTPLTPRFVGNADFTLTATASSGLHINYTSSDTTVATIVAGNKVHIKKEGTTNITANQNGNTYYSVATPVSQVLNISINTQTITFPVIPAKTLAEADFSPNATASSGLTITYTSSDTAVATIVSGNKVHLKAAGATNISALQAGNDTYIPATPVTRQLTVTKANQTISFPGLYRTASSGDFALNANSSAGLPVTYTINDTTVATIINGNTVHVKKAGSLAITGTQPGNNIYNAVTVNTSGYLYGSTQTISFPIPEGGFYNYQLCNRQVKLTATATSGLPITYTSSDTAIVSISRDTMYFKKAGIAYVTAHQDGNLNYYATNPVERKVVVTGTDTTNYIPSLSIYYTPKLTTLCAGSKQVLTFAASVKNGGSTPSYQWKKNNKNVGSNTATYIDSFSKAGTDSIWCILTSSTRCVVNNTVKSNTLGITVHAVSTDTPTVKVISYVPNACLNRAVTFQASIKNGGPAPFFQWKKNGKNVGTDSSLYVDSVLLNTDTVWCVVTASQYCAAVRQVVSNKIVQGVVYIKPGAPGAIRGLSSVTVSQQRVGYGVDRVNDVTYEWAVPAGATILAGQGTNQIVVNWGSTGGNITVRAKNPCGFTDKSILAVTVSPAFGSIINNSDDEVNNGKAGTRVQLYPNPAAYTAYVDFTAPEAGKYFIQVTDAQGRVLQTKETNAVKGNNKVTVDVSRYAQGLYFIRLAGSNRQQSLRLLIQR